MQLQHIGRLKERLAEIQDVRAAHAALYWDQATYMPPKGAAARADQLATLGAIAHRAFVDAETARLLDRAEEEARAAGLDEDSDETRLARVTRRDYDRATRVPAAFVEEAERTEALAYEAWVAARAADNFAEFAPWLRKTYDLARRRAEYLGYEGHPYDALLDIYEPDATVAQAQPLFDRLRAELVPLLRRIMAHADRVDDAVLHAPTTRRRNCVSPPRWRVCLASTSRAAGSTSRRILSPRASAPTTCASPRASTHGSCRSA